MKKMGLCLYMGFPEWAKHLTDLLDYGLFPISAKCLVGALYSRISYHNKNRILYGWMRYKTMSLLCLVLSLLSLFLFHPFFKFIALIDVFSISWLLPILKTCKTLISRCKNVFRLTIRLARFYKETIKLVNIPLVYFQ